MASALSRVFRFYFARVFYGAGNVPRPDGHREYEFVRAVFVFKRFDVADLDDDLLAGHDVRNGLRENIRPFLIKQAGRFAFGFRRFIDLAGLFAFHYLSANDALPDLHCHVVDGAVLRKRKCIDRLDGLGKTVLKFLNDPHAGDKAADVRPDVCGFQRTCAEFGAFLLERIKCSLCGFLCRCADSKQSYA